MIPDKKLLLRRLCCSYLLAAAIQTLALMLLVAVYAPMLLPTTNPAAGGAPHQTAYTAAFFWLTPLTTAVLTARGFGITHVLSLGVFVASLVLACRRFASFRRTIAGLRIALVLVLLAVTLTISPAAFSLAIFALVFSWSLLSPFPKTAPRLRIPALVLAAAAAAFVAWDIRQDHDCSIPGIASGAKEMMSASDHHTIPVCRLDFGTGRWEFAVTSHNYYNCRSITGEPGNLLAGGGSGLPVCRAYHDLR